MAPRPYRELLHPRNRLGQWRDVPGAMNRAAQSGRLMGERGRASPEAPVPQDSAPIVARYDLRLERVPALQKRLKALSRRAAKLGLPPITMRQVGQREMRPRLNSFGRPTSVLDPWASFEVTGRQPVINGWRFVATLQHQEHGNVIRQPPFHPEGVDPPDLTRFRDASKKCDYCHTNRDRSNTYLVQRVADGKIKQVGSSCMKDFLGHADPHALVAHANWLGQFDVEARAERDPGDGGAGGRESFFEAQSFLATVHASIRAHGWRPRSGTGGATVDHVIDELLKPDSQLRVEEQDTERARKALAWARDEMVPGNSDFMHNLKVVLSDDAIPWRNTAIAAATFAAYDRAMGRQRERQREIEGAPEGFLGKIGDKIATDAKLLSTHYIEGNYGVTSLYTFQTASGHRIKWFSSRNLRLEDGNDYHVAGTVKSHDHYKGRDATVITRAKVGGAGSAPTRVNPRTRKTGTPSTGNVITLSTDPGRKYQVVAVTDDGKLRLKPLHRYGGSEFETPYQPDNVVILEAYMTPLEQAVATRKAAAASGDTMAFTAAFARESVLREVAGFQERAHPRNRLGRWVNVLDRLSRPPAPHPAFDQIRRDRGELRRLEREQRRGGDVSPGQVADARARVAQGEQAYRNRPPSAGFVQAQGEWQAHRARAAAERLRADVMPREGTRGSRQFVTAMLNQGRRVEIHRVTGTQQHVVQVRGEPEMPGRYSYGEAVAVARRGAWRTSRLSPAAPGTLEGHAPLARVPADTPRPTGVLSPARQTEAEIRRLIDGGASPASNEVLVLQQRVFEQVMSSMRARGDDLGMASPELTHRQYLRAIRSGATDAQIARTYSIPMREARMLGRIHRIGLEMGHRQRGSGIPAAERRFAARKVREGMTEAPFQTSAHPRDRSGRWAKKLERLGYATGNRHAVGSLDRLERAFNQQVAFKNPLVHPSMRDEVDRGNRRAQLGLETIKRARAAGVADEIDAHLRRQHEQQTARSAANIGSLPTIPGARPTPPPKPAPEPLDAGDRRQIEGMISHHQGEAERATTAKLKAHHRKRVREYQAKLRTGLREGEMGTDERVQERREMIAEATWLERERATELDEAADSMRKASQHEPVGKGGSNWITKTKPGNHGQLPAYIQHIANDLREKRGKSTSNAIQIAIGVVKRWCRGGGDVSPTTKAAACKAVAEWEGLKAKNASKKVAESAHVPAYLDGADVLTLQELRLFGRGREGGVGGAYQEHSHPRNREGEWADKLGSKAAKAVTKVPTDLTAADPMREMMRLEDAGVPKEHPAYKRLQAEHGARRAHQAVKDLPDKLDALDAKTIQGHIVNLASKGIPQDHPAMRKLSKALERHGEPVKLDFQKMAAKSVAASTASSIAASTKGIAYAMHGVAGYHEMKSMRQASFVADGFEWEGEDADLREAVTALGAGARRYPTIYHYEKEHPRDRLGRWVDVLNTLKSEAPNSRVVFPEGVSVGRHWRGGFSVRKGGKRKFRARTPERALGLAIALSEASVEQIEEALLAAGV